MVTSRFLPRAMQINSRTYLIFSRCYRKKRDFKILYRCEKQICLNCSFFIKKKITLELRKMWDIKKLKINIVKDSIKLVFKKSVNAENN